MELKCQRFGPKKSKVKKKTLHPEWDKGEADFVFPIFDPHQKNKAAANTDITISVHDDNGMMSNDPMGTVVVKMDTVIEAAFGPPGNRMREADAATTEEKAVKMTLQIPEPFDGLLYVQFFVTGAEAGKQEQEKTTSLSGEVLAEDAIEKEDFQRQLDRMASKDSDEESEEEDGLKNIPVLAAGDDDAEEGGEDAASLADNGWLPLENGIERAGERRGVR